MVMGGRREASRGGKRRLQLLQRLRLLLGLLRCMQPCSFCSSVGNPDRTWLLPSGGLVTSPISCFLPSLTVLIPSPVSSFQGIRGQQEAEADGTLHLCGAKYNVPQTQLITNLVWVHHAPLLWVRNGQWCCHASLKWLTTITFCFPRWLFFPLSCDIMQGDDQRGAPVRWRAKSQCLFIFVNCVKVTY